ncbi:MAG TPA: hypothetical protein VN809_16760, partial [Telmatospirillum sp.]|nr:hypothetical protein [Telmatospirillum sp.]
GEAVTNHLTIQKTAPIFNLKPCALEVALMPDGAYEGEGAGKKRVSCLTLAAVYRDRRQALHLPAVCRDDLMPILSLLALDRETTFSSGAVPSEPESGITLQRFDAAGVIRCHVDGIGADFSDCVRDIDRDAGAVSVVEVFLRADTAAAPWAVSVLRERGFFLSGFVPLWFGADAILMQKLSVAPDFDTIKLHSPEAQALGERVRRDYQRVQT